MLGCLVAVAAVRRAEVGASAILSHQEDLLQPLASGRGQARAVDPAVDKTPPAAEQAASQALQVHVITYKRPKSLARLLHSLEQTQYDNDRVDLHIHVDAPATPEDNAQVKQVGLVAKTSQASWPFGSVSINEAAQHTGLRDMWLGCWTPSSASERALILEDDLELSPQWYQWLKSAHKAYPAPNNLAGISLQRLAWSPSGRPLHRLLGHNPMLSPTVSTWAFSPSAAHWQDFKVFMRERSESAALIAKFSSVDSHPGYALQSGWQRTNKREALNLWSPSFSTFCGSKGLLTLYPSLQPDYHALAVHWRTRGTHYRGKEKPDFILAREWLPGMSSFPSMEGLAQVPFNGFATSKTNLLAADATDDALAAYKQLEDEASARAAASGSADDTELFTEDAWEWDEDRARQLFVPSLAQLVLLCAATANLILLAVAASHRAVAWIRGRAAVAAEKGDGMVSAEMAKAEPATPPTGVSVAAMMGRLYTVCLPCAELSFWLSWCTIAEFVLPYRERTHAPGDFWELMLLLTLVSLVWQRPVKPAKGAASLLSRELTNEWRGWMQAAFLMYHYCNMQETYPFIRLLVSAYVWQTGFGNGMYFIAKKEFTSERLYQMLWRLNFLVLLLVLATKTPWIAYYVCALHTVHFLMIFGAMWIGCALLYRTRGIIWWPLASLCGLTIFCVLLWDVPKVYDYTIGIAISWAFGADFNRELQFRTFLDHYSSCFGLLAAACVPLAESWARRRPARTYIVLGAMATALAAAWVYCYVLTAWDESHTAYDLIHPYISTLPLWLYVLVRGATQQMRNTVSVPLAFIGTRSLEFYLLQFHLFLSHEAGAILMLVPNKRLNVALVLPIYILTAHRTFHLTNVIKDFYFGLSNTLRMSVSVYIAFGALLAAAGASGDLPLWAVWPLAVLLLCTPPLCALAVASASTEWRDSYKKIILPIIILGAVIVPLEVAVGSALRPLVREGAASNVAAEVTTDPDWSSSDTQGVLDGSCSMVTLPATWLPGATVQDSCPGVDDSSFDGWRAAVTGRMNMTTELLGLDATELQKGREAHTAAADHHFVVFWGDSTVRFQFMFWVELLGSQIIELSDFSLTSMKPNKTDVLERTPPRDDRPLPPDPTQLFVWYANGKLGTRNISAIYVGTGALVPIEDAQKVLSQLEAAPYSFDLQGRTSMLLVGAAGLHHLHLEPIKEWDEPSRWLNLESRLEAGLGALQKWLPNTKLTYFTIHSMCDDLLKEDGWTDMAHKYANGRGNCTGKRCSEATFSRSGALTWFSRETSVLKKKQYSRWQPIEAFKLTDGQCWATADGRHFNPMLPQFTFSALTEKLPSYE
jgi:hypothetical protein